MYSIVDLETTGFSPARGDKTLEVGVVKVNEDHQIVDSYSTLVNPLRDISNYDIHGIDAQLVHEAPTFEQIKPTLQELIYDTTLVAHNASFDFRFLNHELFDNEVSVNGICTLQLSRIVEPAVSTRNLEFLCDYYNIKVESAHQALSDAKATAKLFCMLKDQYCRQHNRQKFIEQFSSPISIKIKSSTFERIEYQRRLARKDIKDAKANLRNYIKRLPTDSLSDDANTRSYLDALNEVLSDRIISKEELDDLKELISDFALSRKQVLNIHKSYLKELIYIYWLDGKISDFESTDVNDLALMLGLEEEVGSLIEEVKAANNISPSEYDVKEKSICFTGKLKASLNGVPVSRTIAQNSAQRKGMVIKKNVTKKLDYLVVADPTTMSGKAKKARRYGTKILAEPEFWRMIGINVE